MWRVEPCPVTHCRRSSTSLCSLPSPDTVNCTAVLGGISHFCGRMLKTGPACLDACVAPSPAAPPTAACPSQHGLQICSPSPLLFLQPAAQVVQCRRLRRKMHSQRFLSAMSKHLRNVRTQAPLTACVTVKFSRISRAISARFVRHVTRRSKKSRFSFEAKLPVL